MSYVQNNTGLRRRGPGIENAWQSKVEDHLRDAAVRPDDCKISLPLFHYVTRRRTSQYGV